MIRKIVLITILAFCLVARASYAEEAAMAAAAAVADIPDASPGGITGSTMPFLQESFQTDIATGAATLSIPITVPPGRKNIEPRLSLSYSSNNANGICGVGWAIPSNFVQRSTKKGVPKYDNTDTFIFASSGSSAELVNIGGNEYRTKIESSFMKYTFSVNIWTVYDKSGTEYTFGSEATSRLENGTKIFSWYLNRVEDVYGNYITYTYEKDTLGQIYIKEIQYTGATDLAPDKSIVFNYADTRTDKLYSYRSGWEIVTDRLLSSIEVKLGGSLVWRYELSYISSPDTSRSLLDSITVYDNLGNSLPPKRFTYQGLE